VRPLRSLQFLQEFRRFQRVAGASAERFSLRWEDRWPCLDDRTETTSFDRHYVFHPAWAARVLAATRPAAHVDISSTLHFCSIVSAFVPVRFFDVRPARLDLPGLQCERGDLARLPFADGELSSVPCMHVLEHVGLGRYGDPLDYDGDLKAIAELKRVTAVGGRLLIVVPIGRARIQYNAHRIYRYRQVVEAFRPFSLEDFALIPDSADDGDLVPSASEALCDRQEYACGCFCFVR